MVTGATRRSRPTVPTGSGKSPAGGPALTGRLATKSQSLPPGGDFDAPEVLAAKARRENFPVASYLLKRRERERLMAVYGFARLTDDLGDEAEGDRLALLDWLEADLERAAVGKAEHPVNSRLTPLITELGLDLQPFRDLIEANRMDQRVTRYESFGDLVGYCMLSAAPVGRLVLAVFDAYDERRVALSDRICIGLQVVEHLQDIGEDAGRGRIYMPAEDMARCGVDEAELSAASASGALRHLVEMEVARTRQLLGAGPDLAASLAIRPRVAVCGFVAGGQAALDAIVAADHDVLAVRCRPARRRLLRLSLAGLLTAGLKRGRS